MKHSHLFPLLVAVIAIWPIIPVHTASGISLDFVTVGDPGNVPDAFDGDELTAGVQNYGSVGYIYAIGKYEVTLLQYTAFLNAVAATDTYSLYNSTMATDLKVAGISRNGSTGSYNYAVIGDGNRPVTYVSWFSAARFMNWLHHGQPTGSQTAVTTEDGAYTLLGATSGAFFQRNVGAQYWLPNENEWYKAAYFDPSAGGPADDYWLYATQSDAVPNSRNGSTSDPNSANFYRDDGLANGYNGGFAISNSSFNPDTVNYLTSVGAFTQADSYYGTFDQSGNVSEYLEATTFSGGHARGGHFYEGENYLGPSRRIAVNTQYGGGEIGFRVATVPEPGSALLLAVAGAGLLARRRRVA